MKLLFKTILPGILLLGSFIAYTAPLNLSVSQEQSEGPVWKKNGKTWMLYDTKGNLLSKEAFSMYGKEWVNGRTWVELNDKYGVIDQTGKCIIPLFYDNIITTFYEAGVIVAGNGKWGFVGWNNDTLLPFRYDIIGNLQANGLIPVNTGGKVNGENDEITGGKWGYLNTFGQEICPVKYDYTGAEWKNGLLWVNIGGVFNHMDQTVSGGKFGLLDSIANEVVPPVFDNIKSAHEAFQQGVGNLFEITDTIPDIIWNY